MLKGGSTTQKGKGKGKPVAADPIVPTKSNSRKGKGVNSACPRDPCAGSASESNKGKGKLTTKGKPVDAGIVTTALPNTVHPRNPLQGQADRVRAQAPVVGGRIRRLGKMHRVKPIEFALKRL